MAERHAAFYRDLAEAAAPGLTGPDQKRLLDGLDRENGNLRAALTWSIEHGAAETALRLGSALWRFWQMRGLLAEGAAGWSASWPCPTWRRHPSRPRQSSGGGRRSRLLAGGDAPGHGVLRGLPGAVPPDRRQTGASPTPSTTGASRCSSARRPSTESRPAFEESLAIFRELGDREMIARVLWGLGNAHYFAGRQRGCP